MTNTPVSPARKSHKKLWIILGSLTLLVIIIASCSGTSRSTPTATPPSASPAAATSAPAAAPVAPAAPAPAPAVVPVAPAPAEPAGPLTTFGNGTYEVGTDVVAGTYRSPGVEDESAPLCYWDQKSADGQIVLGQQGVANEGPSRATLKKGLTFTTSGCQDWVKVN